MPFFTRAKANELRAILGALRSATAEGDVDKAHGLIVGLIVSLRALTEGVPLGTVIGSCRSLDETAEWLRNVLTSEGATMDELQQVVNETKRSDLEPAKFTVVTAQLLKAHVKDRGVEWPQFNDELRAIADKVLDAALPQAASAAQKVSAACAKIETLAESAPALKRAQLAEQTADAKRVEAEIKADVAEARVAVLEKELEALENESVMGKAVRKVLGVITNVRVIR